jgi:outer membrane protein
MKFRYTLLLALLICLPALAQETYTYQDIVRVALSQNLAIKRQQNRQQAYYVEKVGGYANLLPSASLSADASQVNGRQFDLLTGQLRNQTSQRMGAGLDVTWNIFNGFSRLSALRETTHLLKAEQHELDRVKQQLLLDVSNAYYQILLDQELVRIARQNLEMQQLRATRVAVLVEVGNTLVDQHVQEAEVQAARMALIEAENRLQQDKIDLANLIQLEPDKSLELSAPAVVPDSKMYSQQSMEELVKQAMVSRPDYKRLKELETASHHNLQATHGRMLPSVGLGYYYGSGYSSFARRENPETGASEIIPFREQFSGMNVGSSIRIGISIPLFNGLQTRTLVSRSKMTMRNNELAMQETERQIHAEVEKALVDLQAFKERTEAARAREEASLKALENQQKRYENGMINLVELTTTNNTYLAAASEAAQAYYSYLLRQATLSYYLGDLDTSGK